MSRVYSVRFSDEQAAAIDVKGGTVWIKEQVLSVLYAAEEPPEPKHEKHPPRTTPSVEEYVAAEVATTKAQMDAGILKEVTDERGRGRLERSEMYAHWRWSEYHAGNVASL